MSLKNVLIIVDNIDESIDFYEELFGLRVITRPGSGRARLWSTNSGFLYHAGRRSPLHAHSAY